MSLQAVQFPGFFNPILRISQRNFSKSKISVVEKHPVYRVRNKRKLFPQTNQTKPFWKNICPEVRFLIELVCCRFA